MIENSNCEHCVYSIGQFDEYRKFKYNCALTNDLIKNLKIQLDSCVFPKKKKRYQFIFN